VESRVFQPERVTARRTGTAGNLSMTSQQVLTKVLTPKVPAAGSSPVQVYFVELLLPAERGPSSNRNVYWLSTKQDATNWKRDARQPGRHDLRVRQPSGAGRTAAVRGPRPLRSPRIRARPGRRGTWPPQSRSPTTSSSTVAFLLRADVRRGTASGDRAAGRQRAAVLDLAVRRRHALPRRDGDADRVLHIGRPARRSPR